YAFSDPEALASDSAAVNMVCPLLSAHCEGRAANPQPRESVGWTSGGRIPRLNQWPLDTPIATGPRLDRGTCRLDRGGGMDRKLVGDEIARITGEAVGNAFRRGDSTRISIRITYGDEQFQLEVSDDREAGWIRTRTVPRDLA